MAILRLPMHSVGTVDNWDLVDTVSSGVNKVQAVNPGPDFESHDEHGTAVQTATLDVLQLFKLDPEQPVQMSSVAEVHLIARCAHVGTGGKTFKLRMKEGASEQDSDEFTTPSDATYADFTFSRTLDPSGDSWLEATLRQSNLEFGIFKSTANGWVVCTSMWAEIDHAPAVQPAQTSMPRLVASQILRLFRLPSGRVLITLRASALDMPIMGDFFLEHYAGPYTDGGGWSDEVWHKRRLRVVSQSHDPVAGTVTIEALDLRNYAVTHWDTMVSPFAVRTTETIISGPARLTRGTTRTFDRDSAAWVAEVGGVVVDLGTDQEKTGPDGTLFEGKSRNIVQNSSFQLGATHADWGVVGGAVVAAETADLLFDSDVSTESMKITGPNPFTGDDGVNQTATHAGNFTVDGVLSIDYKADDAGALLIQDNVTSDFWNFSTEAWGAADTGRLSLPASSAIDRVQAHVEIVSSGATYLIGIRVADVDDTVMRVYHVQFEGETTTFDRFATHASSRIVSGTTSATVREQDALSITNDQERPAVVAAQGTAIVKIKSTWTSQQWDDSATLGSIPILGIFRVTGFSNAFTLRYAPDAGSTRGFTFAAHAATVFFNNDEFATVGDERIVACRWTGPNAELGLAANTISMFVDGVLLGSSAGSATTHTSDGVLEIGTDTSGAPLAPCDAFLSQLEFLPYVLTDEEIKALP